MSYGARMRSRDDVVVSFSDWLADCQAKCEAATVREFLTNVQQFVAASILGASMDETEFEPIGSYLSGNPDFFVIAQSIAHNFHGWIDGYFDRFFEIVKPRVLRNLGDDWDGARGIECDGNCKFRQFYFWKRALGDDRAIGIKFPIVGDAVFCIWAPNDAGSRAILAGIADRSLEPKWELDKNSASDLIRAIDRERWFSNLESAKFIQTVENGRSLDGEFSQLVGELVEIAKDAEELFDRVSQTRTP
jgi:hypothetical protein